MFSGVQTYEKLFTNDIEIMSNFYFHRRWSSNVFSVEWTAILHEWFVGMWHVFGFDICFIQSFWPTWRVCDGFIAEESASRLWSTLFHRHIAGSWGCTFILLVLLFIDSKLLYTCRRLRTALSRILNFC